ncbi:hypothetical protein GGX14DRAFT_414508 [Mycena pura]|uniref:Uncharacterized protein n=1 Tax=Mycena pura TaxID=153505 RepID=A0AAD7E4R4_9AGAR|nr:hypothetical protein GGX14DRAFT_414508 [Mycena pura]
MADLFPPFNLAEEGLSRKYRTIRPILDQLSAAYFSVLDAVERTLCAYAKYFFCCCRALAPQEIRSAAELDALAAFEELGPHHTEVRRSVNQAVDRWQRTASLLRSELEKPFGMMPAFEWLWRYLNPDCIPVRRKVLLTKLPSFRANAEQHLHRLGEVFVVLQDISALQDISEQLEAATNSAQGAEATDQLRRSFRIAISALLQLDEHIVACKTGLLVANGEIRHWPIEHLHNTPIRILLAAENEQRSAYYVTSADSMT